MSGATRRDVSGGCGITEPAATQFEVSIDPPVNGHLLLPRGGLAPIAGEQTGKSRWGTLLLAYKTLGVVFGGLVTSPLYVYPSMPLTSPTEEDYLGVYSIMFWTLTLIGVVKYTCVALNADDQGE
ncbi:hypothetical protein CRG98_032758, partial [Punica granatum]